MATISYTFLLSSCFSFRNWNNWTVSNKKRMRRRAFWYAWLYIWYTLLSSVGEGSNKLDYQVNYPNFTTMEAVFRLLSYYPVRWGIIFPKTAKWTAIKQGWEISENPRKLCTGQCRFQIFVFLLADVMIDGKNFFDQPVKNDKVTYENIRKVATG